jgi:hypothetical protein
MKLKHAKLPNYLCVYFEKMHLKAYQLEKDNKQVVYLISHDNFVLETQTLVQLHNKARRLFMQFFYTYMQRTNDLKWTIEQKIEFFLIELDLSEDEELKAESFVRLWQRWRTRKEKPKKTYSIGSNYQLPSLF